MKKKPLRAGFRLGEREGSRAGLPGEAGVGSLPRPRGRGQENFPQGKCSATAEALGRVVLWRKEEVDQAVEGPT